MLVDRVSVMVYLSLLITDSQALYELNLHFINVLQNDRLSRARQGPSKDIVDRMTNAEYTLLRLLAQMMN